MTVLAALAAVVETLGFIVLVRIVVVESKVASRVAEAGIDDRLALVLVLW